jgi:glycosyltransferase involved in cell wall biosynthesis
LQHWDKASSCLPDHFIAQSKIVAGRIREYYGRCAEVIYPPIDIHRFRPAPKHDEYYLVISQPASSRRVDLAVQACTRLRRKLLIMGIGGDRERFKSLAGPTVSFIEPATDSEVEHHLSRCQAMLLLGEEDFAAAPLEAAAAGRPSIAYRAGGALETIVEDRTGILFNELTPEDLIDAIERFEHRAWSPELIRLHAEQFSAEAFQERFSAFLQRIGIPLLNTGSGSAPESRVLAYST